VLSGGLYKGINVTSTKQELNDGAAPTESALLINGNFATADNELLKEKVDNYIKAFEGEVDSKQTRGFKPKDFTTTVTDVTTHANGKPTKVQVEGTELDGQNIIDDAVKFTFAKSFNETNAAVNGVNPGDPSAVDNTSITNANATQTMLRICKVDNLDGVLNLALLENEFDETNDNKVTIVTNYCNVIKSDKAHADLFGTGTRYNDAKKIKITNNNPTGTDKDKVEALERFERAEKLAIDLATLLEEQPKDETSYQA